jgi:hypothetical protein
MTWSSFANPPNNPICHLGDLIKQLNAANAIQDPARREDAVPGASKRVFVGKNEDRSASVSLSDAEMRRVDDYARARLPSRTPVARGPLTRSSISSNATLSPTISLLKVPNVVSLR